jgi:hypothetical protein
LLLKYGTKGQRNLQPSTSIPDLLFFIYLFLDDFVGESGIISIPSLFQALTLYQKSGYKVLHWV